MRYICKLGGKGCCHCLSSSRTADICEIWWKIFEGWKSPMHSSNEKLVSTVIAGLQVIINLVSNYPMMKSYWAVSLWWKTIELNKRAGSLGSGHCHCSFGTLGGTCLSANLRIHACLQRYMHACMHTYMHTCLHAYMHACMHARIHAYMLTCIHACMYVCMYACVFVDRPVCMHAYILACCHCTVTIRLSASGFLSHGKQHYKNINLKFCVIPIETF